jgi:hypothetical protein
LTCLGLNLNLGDFSGSTLLFVLCGETCFLALWCAGDRCGMAGSDEDRGRSRRLGAEYQAWSSIGRVLSGWMVERSGDDLSLENLFLRVAELENALCNQDKLPCNVFRENKRLNLELKNSFSEITSLLSMHDDMSVKPCENCKMIMVNYADLWIVHTQIASQLKDAKLELRELKAYSMLLGACTSCPLLKSDLEASSSKIKELKHKLDHSSCYSVLSSPCEICGPLKGKLFHPTKENTKLKQ